MLRLVDLSNNNAGPIDFGALRKAGTFGVWLKVSEGLDFADALYHDRARAARIVGLRAGGYHFARPSIGSAGAEAHHFVALLGKVHRRDLCPVLDLEKNDHRLSGPDLHLWARTFELFVRELTGARALLYCNPSFVRTQGWGRPLGTGRGLWLADYGPNDGREHPPNIPEPWHRIAAHQYTSRGRVAGVPGDVDLSHARRRRAILAHPVAGWL